MSDVKELAKHITEKYAHGLDGLSSDDCHDLVYAGYEGTFLKNSQCDALQDVLGYGIEGTVTAPDRERLEKGVKFSPKFVDALAGEDGRAALRRRAAWLGEFYLTYNKKVKESDRQAALDEILDIGAAADGAIPALIRAAGHKDDAVRAKVAKILGKFGPKASDAIPALIGMLKDKGGGASRIEAARALGKIGEKLEAVPALASVFHSEDKALRIAAIEAVAEIGAAEAVYDLALVSQDQDLDVRQAVKAAFKVMNVPERTIILTLMGILEDPDVSEEYRGWAVWILGEWGAKAAKAVPILKEICKSDKDEGRRIEAAEALAKIGAFKALKEIGGDEAVHGFILQLENPDMKVRRAAAYLIGEIGSAKNIEDLLAVIDDKAPEVRAIAARSIGKLGKGDKEAIKVLERLLDDNDSKVLVAAVKALGDMGAKAKAAFKDVARLLEDVDVEVRKAAVRALLKIDPEAMVGAIKKLGDNEGDAVPILRGALKSKSPAMRRAALKSLGNMGEKAKAAAPDIVGLMGKMNAKDKALAAEALGETGDSSDKTYMALLSGLIDDAKDVRRASAQAIDKLGYAKLISFMANKDLNIRIRKAAADTLGGLGPKAAPFLPMLVSLIGAGGDENSRIMAAYVIGKIGPDAKDAGPALVRARDGGSNKLKKAAALAIERIGYEEPKPKEPLTCDIKKAVPRMIEALEGGEVEEKLTAISCLAGMGVRASRAVPHIAGLMSSKDARVKAAAEKAILELGRAKVKSTAEPLSEIIRDGDKGLQTRADAAKALAEIGTRKARRVLVGMFGDKDVSHILIAKTITDLGKGASQFVPELLLALRKGNEDERSGAVFVLGQMGKTAYSALPRLRKMLKSDDADLRSKAEYLIGKIKPDSKVAGGTKEKKKTEKVDPAIAEYLAGIGDPDFGKRLAAAKALLAMGDAAAPAVPGLVEALESGDENARASAVYVLGRLGKVAYPALPKLKKMLKSDDADLRSKAEYLIGKIKPGSKVAGGTKEKKKTEKVDPAIAEHLAGIGDPDFAKRLAAAKALLAMGEAAAPAVPGLVDALRGGDEDARSSAVYVLARMGGTAKAAVGDLMEMAEGDDEALALKAMYILGKMGPAAKKAAPVLKKMAKKGKSEDIKEGAKAALEGIKGK